jgi:hypothetical protein
MLMFSGITRESCTLSGGPGKETRGEVSIKRLIRRGRVLDGSEANGLK